MKEWVAEYGGVIIAVILGIAIIVALSGILDMVTV